MNKCFRNLIFMVCVVSAATGCTHCKLRRNAVHQAWTVGEFHQQQVLNNLAMFAYNYNSLPSFSYPNQGSLFVTDQGTVGMTPGFSRPTGGPVGIVGRFLFTSLGLSFTGQRAAQEGFTVTPINDPRKLELMRCAYQQALSNCGLAEVSGNCPDCKTRFNVFYTGDPDGDIRQSSKGTVTSECIKPNCWLRVGCKKCVPKDCCCTYVGHYCGVYVWVPNEGRDELTKLTMCILDFALKDPPQRIGKEVVYYVDELGLPTERARAVGQISAQVAVNERPESLLNLPRADEARIMQYLEGRLENVRQRLANAQVPQDREFLLKEEVSLENKIEYLNEQLRVGGLKEEFIRSGPSAPPFSVIPQLEQQIQTHTSPRVLGP